MSDNLFSTTDADELTSAFPHDNFKTVAGYDGEKGYQYEARSLIHMGATTISHAHNLSPAWQQLTQDLLSREYREAMSQLTGLDLLTMPIEVNVFNCGQGARLGPHIDLKDKIVTHILYFNADWKIEDGGCLAILRSQDISDVEFTIPPIIGNSSIVVRSQQSWHAVTAVANNCCNSRRSMTVTFYHPGSISTMWPPGDITPLHSHTL